MGYLSIISFASNNTIFLHKRYVLIYIHENLITSEIQFLEIIEEICTSGKVVSAMNVGQSCKIWTHFIKL